MYLADERWERGGGGISRQISGGVSLRRNSTSFLCVVCYADLNEISSFKGRCLLSQFFIGCRLFVLT